MTARISVLGNGSVGTVVAACFAGVGHDVVGLEADEAKSSMLRHGRARFFEAGLDEMADEGVSCGRLRVSADPFEAIGDLAGLRSLMRGDLLVDGRNMLDAVSVTGAGFVHDGMGRTHPRRRQEAWS